MKVHDVHRIMQKSLNKTNDVFRISNDKIVLIEF